MKLNGELNGYRITTKPTNDGAGKCLWAFAEKDGAQYFVKEFLDPKRPRPESMGDAAAKQQLLAQCEDFERRHWSVIDRLDPDDLDAGNLVTAVDFFFVGTRYYKVTRRLDPVDLDPHTLSDRQKSVLLGTLLDSLALLHRLDIVHSDLKPQNILLHRPPGSDLLTAKLIDFDDAYVSGQPPGRQVIGGDAMYASPEWIRYAGNDSGTGPGRMTTASDLFALGLIVHQYLTGALPAYDPAYASPAGAVNARRQPVPDPRLQSQIDRLVRQSLSADPAVRPDATQWLPVIAQEYTVGLRSPAREPAPGHPASRLRISFATERTATRPAIPIPPTASRNEDGGVEDSYCPAPAEPPSGSPPSRLRINIRGRTPADRHPCS